MYYTRYTIVKKKKRGDDEHIKILIRVRNKYII